MKLRLRIIPELFQCVDNDKLHFHGPKRRKCVKFTFFLSYGLLESDVRILVHWEKFLRYTFLLIIIIVIICLCIFVVFILC
jgi:hypothetical protein